MHLQDILDANQANSNKLTFPRAANMYLLCLRGQSSSLWASPKAMTLMVKQEPAILRSLTVWQAPYEF